MMIAQLEDEFRDPDFYLTLASPADYLEVEALSEAAARTDVAIPLSARTIEWLIDRNPQGEGFLVLVRATADARIVGHFLFYAKEMASRARHGDKPSPLVAYLCVYLYVAQHCRRRGLFERMTAFGIGLLRRTGMYLIYTVPNPRSAPGFLKFGMKRLGAIPFRIGLASKWKMPSLPHRSEKPVEWRSAFDDQFMATLKPLPPRRAVIWGKRDAKILNWRYWGRPEVDYKIWYLGVDDRSKGYLVTRKMTIMNYKTLVLCDFWLEPPTAGSLNKMIAAALADHGRDASLVITMAGSPDTSLGSTLWRSGLIRLPQWLLPQPVVIIGSLIDDPMDQQLLPRVEDWLTTPFDWDVF